MAFQEDAFQDDAFQLLHAGVGGAGAATFAILVEEGASVRYSWKTVIRKAWSGLETRAAVLAKPRQRYEFATILTDAQHRRVLSTLAGNAADAPLFLLGISYEALPVVSSTLTTVTVNSLAFCDWAVEGQRVVVRSADGELGEGVVQFTTGATIALDVDLTAVAGPGSEIMPAMGVFLETEQALSRYAVNAGTWSLVAYAERNGFAPGSVVGTGATVTTYDSLPVWDRGVALEEAAQPLLTGAELVDLGARIGALGNYDVVDWGRAIRIESSSRDDWQWFRLFLDTVRGQQVAFLLPTGRPDLVPIGDASSGALTVEGPPVDDAPDYASDWFPSLAHRRIKLVKTDGTIAYRTVIACTVGTGTQELTLNSALAGALERVELLETVRLDSDEVMVKWSGWSFEATIGARVVQQ